MSKYNNNHLIGVGIAALAMIPVAAIVNGFLIAYAWNELITPIWALAPISNWQGMGLSTFVSIFLAGIARDSDANENASFTKLMVKILVTWALLFLVVWVVSQTY